MLPKLHFMYSENGRNLKSSKKTLDTWEEYKQKITDIHGQRFSNVTFSLDIVKKQCLKFYSMLL